MPRDGTITRERILDVAERLVIEQGFSATPLDQVIAEAATSKGAFFHHFDSKVDLARALVARYVEADLAQLEFGLAAAAAVDDPKGRVVAFLRHFEDQGDEMIAVQSGCLYASVLAEQDLLRGEVRHLVEQAAVAWRRAIVDLLRPALPASALDLDALADHVYVTFEGAFLLYRTTEDASAMRAQLQVLRQLVEHLLSD